MKIQITIGELTPGDATKMLKFLTSQEPVESVENAVPDSLKAIPTPNPVPSGFQKITMEELREILIPLKTDPRTKARVNALLKKYAPKTGKLSEVNESQYPKMEEESRKLEKEMAEKDLPFEKG